MRKLLTTASLALGVAILAPAVATATHSNGDGPDNDFAKGTVHLERGSQTFDQHVNATSEPLGQNARGNFVLHSNTSVGRATISGRVTCLRVLGNQARIGGTVERSTHPQVEEGFGAIIDVQDNGEPGDNDTSQATLPSVPPGSLCGPPTALTPFTGGNYVVHNALP